MSDKVDASTRLTVRNVQDSPHEQQASRGVLYIEGKQVTSSSKVSGQFPPLSGSRRTYTCKTDTRAFSQNLSLRIISGRVFRDNISRDHLEE